METNSGLLQSFVLKYCFVKEVFLKYELNNFKGI